METKHKIGIAITVGLAVAATIIVVRQKVRKQGWTHNKLASKLFNVPFAPLDSSFNKKYRDLQEQTENEQTKDGITFRADGGQDKPCGMGGTYCKNGTCIKGHCISK